ncbi:NmrA family NAD(P)-binding protein [Pedobacter sp. R-06]|uniref:NmrA family NAD(P)-binding protein n=1 Tax=Pedobacter sp. R-06 TaxID=3404051 RepID=UPI003CF5204E
MIAITGANGNLGRATIDFLLQKVKANNITAIVRNPQRASSLEELGVNIRIADYNDSYALENAFKGVDHLVQISTTSIGQKGIDQENSTVTSAIKAGVSHIIYTSSVKPSSKAHFIAARQSIETENTIMSSQLSYTFFRNSLYMEALPALLGSMVDEGVINYPAGKGKISFVSRMDIAEAIGKVALSPENHKNAIYEITGSHAYTFSELAEVINSVKKNGTAFCDIPLNDYREELEQYQVPAEVIDLLVSMAKGISSNEFSFVDEKLKTLLDRDPVTLNTYLRKTL